MRYGNQAKKFLHKLKSDLLSNISNIYLLRIFFLIRNFFSINIKSLGYFYCDQSKLFYVIDNKKKHFFSNLPRGLKLYKNGLNHRAAEIANSYLLQKINFRSHDIVIDCGANYGDLWLYLSGKISESNYISFEPGINEFKALELNVINGRNNFLALGEKKEIKPFFINEQDADSSLIEPKIYNRIDYVQKITLDEYVSKNKITSIRLLKLEAEGFEPEILEGSKNSLKLIDYITIDGGFERGVNKDETFTKQSDILAENNFQLIDRNMNWMRALFVRRGT